MPVLLFTAGEIATSLVDKQRQLSDEILELADLKEKPLNPGESVADRHHKIAKLGKQLAETFRTFDTIMRGAAGDEPADQKQDEQAAPASPDAN